MLKKHYYLYSQPHYYLALHLTRLLMTLIRVPVK